MKEKLIAQGSSVTIFEVMQINIWEHVCEQMFFSQLDDPNQKTCGLGSRSQSEMSWPTNLKSQNQAYFTIVCID